MSNNEVIERLEAAFRNIRIVVNPMGLVTVYAEDIQNELPGKRYVFYMETTVEHWQKWFEGQNILPPLPGGTT